MLLFVSGCAAVGVPTGRVGQVAVGQLAVGQVAVWLCLLLCCGTAARGSPMGQEEPVCGNSPEQLLLPTGIHCR